MNPKFECFLGMEYSTKNDEACHCFLVCLILCLSAVFS